MCFWKLERILVLSLWHLSLDYSSPISQYSEEFFLTISPTLICPTVYGRVLWCSGEVPVLLDWSKYLILKYQIYRNVLSYRPEGTCFSCSIVFIFLCYQFNGDDDQTHSFSMRECSGFLSTDLLRENRKWIGLFSLIT